MAEGEPTKRVEVEDPEDVAEEVDSLDELEDAEFESGASGDGDIILTIY